jgi:hypothetical protein
MTFVVHNSLIVGDDSILTQFEGTIAVNILVGCRLPSRIDRGGEAF